MSRQIHLAIREHQPIIVQKQMRKLQIGEKSVAQLLIRQQQYQRRRRGIIDDTNRFHLTKLLNHYKSCINVRLLIPHYFSPKAHLQVRVSRRARFWVLRHKYYSRRQINLPIEIGWIFWSNTFVLQRPGNRNATLSMISDFTANWYIIFMLEWIKV